VPSPFGNFALTTRQVFNPRTRRFDPSPTGPYVFTTQGNLISDDTGRRVPVLYAGLGRVNPLNPFSPFNPVNQARITARNYYGWLLLQNAASANNPYIVNTYSPAGYGGYGGGYGDGYYPGGGYGGGYAAPTYGGGYGASPYVNTNYAANATSTIPAYTPYDAPKKQDAVLSAFGVPNENGAIEWPLAFRLMPPDRRQVLEKLESQLRVVASQTATGKASPVVVNEARRSIEELQSWLKSRRLDLASATYTEANTLLQNLGKTLRNASY
jgi:hypothetical protein